MFKVDAQLNIQQMIRKIFFVEELYVSSVVHLIRRCIQSYFLCSWVSPDVCILRAWLKPTMA